MNLERWVSDAARCSASQGKEEPRVDERSGELHQLHREGLLMVGRVLIVNPERWCYGAESSDATNGTEAHCGAQRRTTRQSGEIHQLDHEGLLVVSRVLVVNPERWRWSALQGDARIRKARICSVCKLPAFTTKG